jgi:alkylation response protein AidB-like acyl-CoA dehydrogenase
MADEPTLGELGRRLDDRIRDVRDDLERADRRIDTRVDGQVYQVQHQAVMKEIADLKADNAALRAERLRDAEKVAAMRRWLIGAVIVPIVAVLLAYLLTKGSTG